MAMYHKHRWLMSVVGLFLVTALTGQAWGESSWRPFADSTVLVTLGMGKAEVLLKAGPPQATELVSVGTQGTLHVTVWTYVRRGHNAAVATLTFRGDTLTNLTTKIVQ